MLRLFNWIGTRFSVVAAWGFLSWGLPLAALLAGAAGGSWAAWQLGRAPLRAENAELRESYAEATRLAVQAGAQRLQAAQEWGNALATELADTLLANNQLSLEKTHALQRVSTGRACLSGPALRVLNSAPGIRVAGLDGLPAAKPAAAATGATPAPHTDQPHAGQPGSAQPGGAHYEAAQTERVATDADIGTWAVVAGARFEACRARLDALIDWHGPAAEAAP